ncbi:hypothetical protein P12x_003047 [Tundrisphaera lichenicola]|uniref:hypothetical protein n=1 Tax=Tundrisphaera lichenicola TaxID=2029860 RepID=UPI003EB84E50
MDSEYDDARRLRERQARAEREASSPRGDAGGGAPCLVGQVLSPVGTDPGAVFKLQAQDLTGDESEGSPGVLDDAGFHFFAINLGSAVPPIGTDVLCTFVSYRWVFRYDG